MELPRLTPRTLTRIALVPRPWWQRALILGAAAVALLVTHKQGD